MDPIDPDQISRHLLSVVTLACQGIFSRENLAFARNELVVQAEVDQFARGLVATIRTKLLAKEMVETSYTSVPADWWAHLKGRWFPKWWLRRWPAKVTKIQTQIVHRVCPHADIRLNNLTHFEWLEYGDVRGVRSFRADHH